MDAAEQGQRCRTVVDELSEAVIADERVLRTILTGVVARGHVLLEDVPGTGKTLTARSFARALGLSFKRIQFTPDLLPADVTGSHVFDEQQGTFEFRQGPIFANVVLADEINRASPKTQSAMLEAMEERQVTVDGETHHIPEPFFVIATQNPVEQGEGTFPLPEAQKDRFLVKSQLGYPSESGEVELLERRSDRTTPTPTVQQVVTEEEVHEMRYAAEEVSVHPDLLQYMVDVVRATREDERVEVGVSPRGSQRLFEAVRAWASLSGRGYVVPDDVQAVAHPVMAHRLVLTTAASVDGVDRATVLDDVLSTVPVPRVSPGPS
ncbi:MAG: AAA family ATPase [Haloarculaceae archaeon]